MTKLSPKTRRAVAKYGRDDCLRAFVENRAGNGARTIGFEQGLTTNQADAAINAGRELWDHGRVTADHLNPGTTKRILARLDAMHAAFDYGSECDRAFDGGEWSGPSLANMELREHEALLERMGLSPAAREEVERAQNEYSQRALDHIMRSSDRIAHHP